MNRSDNNPQGLDFNGSEVAPTGRRRILGGAIAGCAFALAAPLAASASPGADAALIALCDQLDANERRYIALYDVDIPIEDEAARDAVALPIQDQQSQLAERITAHRITTLAGFAAVARSLGLWDSTIREPEDHTGINEQLIAMLVRDGKAIAAGGVA